MVSKVGSISDAAYLGVGIWLILQTAAFIVMRCVISSHQYKKLLADDWLSIISFIINVSLYAFNEYQFKSFSQPVTLDYKIRAGLAVPILAAFSLATSKVPILLLYIRIFGIKRWVRYISIFVLLLSSFGFLGATILPLVQCRPFDTPFTPPKWQRCGTANLYSGVSQGAISVAIDLAIIVIPLRPIYKLNLSLRRRIGLGLVFISGLLGVVASVVSLAYKANLLLGARSDYDSIHATQLLQLVECVIAIMVGCVPAVSGFWNWHIVPSKFYVSIRSFGSKISVSSKTTTTGQPHSKPDYIHHEDIIPIKSSRMKSDLYIQMGSTRESTEALRRSQT